MQELLYERIRNILLVKEVTTEEKNMMGGITFMVDNKMCFGTYKGGLLCRIDPQERETLLEEVGTSIIRQGGREMKGYVHVQPAAYASDQELEYWIAKCLAFNPKAKSSQRKRAI